MKYRALEECAKQYWPKHSSILAWRNPLLIREAWQATVYRVTELDTAEATLHSETLRLFCLWQLCPSESWAWRWHSCLACGEPGSTKFAGTGTVSTTGVVALSESYFKSLALVTRRPLWPVFLWSSTRSGTQRAPLLGVLCFLACQVHRGAPHLESYSVDLCAGHLKGHPGWGPTL